MTTYAIRGGEEGARRLELVAHIMEPATAALHAAAGVGPGMTCLDFGCGPGHVSRALARRVAPGGRVVGIDVDAVKLDAARRECDRAGLANVEFRMSDATLWAEPDSYDVAYGRFIMSHLAERGAIIGRLVEALRPGGVLMLEDIEFAGSFCWPPNAAYTRYCELYGAVIARRGGDPDLGPRLYPLCVDAGLEDVHVGVVQFVHAARAPEKQLCLTTMVNICDAVEAEGLASSEELAETVAALAAFTDDPRSLLGSPRVFQVWGRKPARRS
ncbi:MAG TPA: methyltransferase domain-containing protein [Gemmatimonadales bacterium]|nr:methyltransferase domain-containing protein [Gemmatimonadales bacterium]